MMIAFRYVMPSNSAIVPSHRRKRGGPQADDDISQTYWTSDILDPDQKVTFCLGMDDNLLDDFDLAHVTISD